MPLTQEDVHINKEVEELKRKIRELAQIHSSRHHCGSGVSEALREVGIDDSGLDGKIKVRIDFTVAGIEGDQSVEYDFDKVDLFGKTHEQQCAWVAESMSPTLIFGDTNFEVELPVTVKDLTKVIPPPPRLERGLRFHKVANGRSAHVLRPTGRDTMCNDVYVGFNASNTPEPEAGTPVCKKCKARTMSHYSVDTGDVV